MIRLYHRLLSLVDALAAEPVWGRPLVSGSPADIPAVGVFDTAFHALLGVAYCRIRGLRLIAGAVWGAGLSLLIDAAWLLLRFAFA